MAEDRNIGHDSPGIESEIRSGVEREAEELGLGETNFVKEALRWQYNWIGLAGAAAFALVSGMGLPLVLAAGPGQPAVRRQRAD